MQVIKQPEHGRTPTTDEKKMIVPSDELWLIADNSKSFANGSKSVIKNNLGLSKRSNTYLIKNVRKHRHGSNGIKI